MCAFQIKPPKTYSKQKDFPRQAVLGTGIPRRLKEGGSYRCFLWSFIFQQWAGSISCKGVKSWILTWTTQTKPTQGCKCAIPLSPEWKCCNIFERTLVCLHITSIKSVDVATCMQRVWVCRPSNRKNKQQHTCADLQCFEDVIFQPSSLHIHHEAQNETDTCYFFSKQDMLKKTAHHVPVWAYLCSHGAWSGFIFDSLIKKKE